MICNHFLWMSSARYRHRAFNPIPLKKYWSIRSGPRYASVQCNQSKQSWNLLFWVSRHPPHSMMQQCSPNQFSRKASFKINWTTWNWKCRWNWISFARNWSFAQELTKDNFRRYLKATLHRTVSYCTPTLFPEEVESQDRMTETRTIWKLYAFSLCLIRKHLHLFSFTENIWIYAPLYTLETKTTIKHYLFSQCHERDYVFL